MKKVDQILLAPSGSGSHPESPIERDNNSSGTGSLNDYQNARELSDLRSPLDQQLFGTGFGPMDPPFMLWYGENNQWVVINGVPMRTDELPANFSNEGRCKDCTNPLLNMPRSNGGSAFEEGELDRPYG